MLPRHLLVVTVMILGCTQYSTRPPVPEVQSRATLTAEQFRELPPGATLLEAVELYRPEFLTSTRSRSGGSELPERVTVVVDGHVAGGAEILKLLRLDGIARVRYLSAIDGRFQFGSRVVGPVLLVTTAVVLRGRGYAGRP